MYDIARGRWKTPRGTVAEFVYRTDTNDWNTLTAAVGEDEYRLGELRLSGVALDIGAHIGAVSVALALDNPGLHVIAVEAVPPNVELLRQNVALNGVEERVTILHAVAGQGGEVRWGYAGDATADHHAFIGNALHLDVEDKSHEAVGLAGVSLADIIGDRQIAFAKVDCEGCEYTFLRGPALAQIALIRGELHGIPGHEATEVVDALIETHHVTTTGPLPCAFEAVRRG